MHDIAALRDIQQCTGQRRSHAWAHQQPGQRAEQGCTVQVATASALAGPVEAVAHGDRQLQLEGAEHWQRQQNEQPRQAAEQPRLLQPGLQAGAQQCGDHTQCGVDQSHAQYIDARQQPAAASAGAVAQHQSGQDRQHGQRAGGKGQQQPQAKERQQAPGQLALLQITCQRLVIRLACARSRSAAAKVDNGGLRRVTQAGVGTALPAQSQLATGRRRDQQLKLAAVHCTVTEEFIVMVECRWQRRLLRCIQAVEFQPLLVQVIAVLDLKLHAQFA
ncbi:hypothetical protein PS623_04629 [Pseudomonas fluorescens]|nr:hypothetical protein PS623_04629 [Pseudomonas fluorescens]